MNHMMCSNEFAFENFDLLPLILISQAFDYKIIYKLNWLNHMLETSVASQDRLLLESILC